VEATSVRQENGEIILEADNGTVADSGTLDASGKNSGEIGGTVKLLGQQVAVADGAKIDVSGDAGGGTALIGGNLHGAGPEPNAQNTTVGKATINASAITSGNGGTVAVYSTGQTEFNGTITSQGGIVSGNGGMVETSGHTLHVGEAASVVTLAPHGKSGTWLLDPDYLTIVSGEAGTTPNETFSTTGSDTIQTLPIITALGSGNVTLQANVDIMVNGNISATTPNTLELDAGHSIFLNANINLNFMATAAGQGSTIILSANDPRGSGNASDASITGTGTLYANNITLKLTGSSQGIGTSTAPVLVDYSDSSTNPPLSLTVASGSDVYLQSQADSTQISATGVNVGAHTFDLSTLAGPILQAPGGAITASSVILDTSIVASDIGSSTTPILLQGPDNNPVTLTAFTGGGNAYFNAQANGGTGYTGSIALGVVSTGNFTLAAQGPVSQVTADTITASNLTVSTTSTGSTVVLDNTGNQISNTASFNTTGAGSDVSFTNGASQVFIGASSVAGNFSINALNGGIQLGSEGAPPIAAANTLTLKANGLINQAGTPTSYVSAGGLNAQATGHIRLTNPDNQISGNVKLNVTDSDEEGVQLVTADSITLVGPSSSGNNMFSVTTHDPSGETTPSLTVTGSINAGGSVGNLSTGEGQSGGSISLQADGNITITNTGSIQTIADPINLTAGGNITVDGPVTTSFYYYTLTEPPVVMETAGSSINLDAGGSINLNASVTAQTGSTPGSLLLTANDPALNGDNGSITNGIFNLGSGVLTAGDISLTVIGSGAASGPIGTPSASIQIANNTSDPVALNLQTSGGDAFIQSASAVTLTNIGLDGDEQIPGSLTLSAVGAIMQDSEATLDVSDLNLATTGSSEADITIGCEDCGISNSILGTSRFSTQNGNVSLINFGTVTLGNSSVGGNLEVEAFTPPTGQILIADSLHPNGMVQATGAISLSAEGDIVEGSSYTSGNPTSLGSNGIPLQPGGASTQNACSESPVTLCAATQHGDVLLGANNNVTGLVDIFGNHFSGTGNIGNISFTNTNGIAIAVGGSPLAGAVATIGVINGGTTPFTLALTSVDGNIEIGGQPTDETGFSVAATSAVHLSAGGSITEDTGGDIYVPTNGQFSATSLSGNLTLTSASNGIDGIITLQSPNTINLVNSVDTTVGSIGNGSSNGSPMAASSVIIDVLNGNSLFQDTTSASSLGITANSISLSTSGGEIGDPEGGPLFLSGGFAGTNPDAATVSLNVSTNGGDAYLESFSPIAVGGTGINLNGDGFGGAFSLTSYGNVSVNAPIVTQNNIVVIDTAGAIQLNAPITPATNGSGPGAIALTANDPNIDDGSSIGFTSSSNGIAGSGLLTAGYISLSAGSGQSGQSGSVGQGTPTQATAPLQVTSDTGEPLSLAIRTYGGNAYVSSAVPLSIDDLSNILLQTYPAGVGAASGINTQSGGGITCGSGACYGEVFLAAAGPITQTYGIQSGILTLTSTGPNAAIALTDTGQSNDPGNSVFGQVHLYTTGSAAYSSGFANNMGANLGASTIGGNLVVISSNGDLDVQDPNGGAVQVTGTTTLSAGAGNGLSIQSPLISGSSLSLVADQNISQSSSGGASLQAGSVLYVQSTSGSISLTDPRNQVGAIALFNAADNVVFQAASSLTLGNVTAGRQIEIGSGGNLTLESGTVLTSSRGSGYSILLSAGGNFINDAGANALSMASGTDFAIFSAAPGGDVFGNLNSGNTPFWDTTFADVIASGTNPGNLGNRYVFAFQPTLTVSANNASKVYGVDDSASLLAGYTVSGLQPGVAGAYLADTLSSVLSTTPTAVSVGSAATANVGTYAITPSNFTLANAYVPAHGYAVVAQNGMLTVTPATLSYLANAASRAFGSANPVFGGTVTGFLNNDTQASSTIGTLSFSSTATATSSAGSYAITGAGLSANNYVFVQAAGNASALTITPPTQPQITGATTVLTSFTAAIEPPLLNPANTALAITQLNLINLPVVPPPPPPPPAPPVQSPLADNNSEQPTSADQTTSQVADSLDGSKGTPGSGPRGGIVIPRMLVTGAPPPPPPTDISALSSFGNSSLWQ
jgi:hypothetical protein